jgi:cytochrome c
MADYLKLATFIKNTMSFGNPGLSDRDALDIAAHVNAQPRPQFDLQEHLSKKK